MRLTNLLAIIILVVFAVTVFVPDVQAFFDFYGFSGAAIMERPYTFVTSIFLHGGLDHLLSNLLVLIFFGYALEKEIGKWRMLSIFLIGAAAGDFLSVLVYGPDIVSIGASAGIFALIGAGMILRPIDVSYYPLVVPMPLILLGLAYSLYNVYGFFYLSQTNISYAGHFGGLFVGLIYGFAKAGTKKALRTLIIGLLALAVIVGMWFALVG